MEKKFTIQEFKNYLARQDSFGDAFYFLTVENVEKANEPEEAEEENEPDYNEK